MIDSDVYKKKVIRYWWQGGSTIDAGYQAVLDRATVKTYNKPTAGEQVKQNTLFAALRSGGIIALSDVFYVFRNDVASNFWKLNWITPASFECTEPGGAVTKGTDTGIQGDGAATYADCNFTPSTQAVQMSTAGGGQAIYLHQVPSSGSFLCGARNVAGANPYIFMQYGGAASLTFNTCGAGFGAVYAGGTPNGSLLYADTDAAGYNLYKNGANVSTFAIVQSPVLATNSVRVGSASGNAGGLSNAIIGMYWLGAKLTSTQQLAFYNAWLAYIS